MRQLVTIFAASVSVNIKVIAKISNAEFQPNSSGKVSGEYTVSSESPVQSFKWTAGRKAKLSEFIFADWTMLLSGEITYTLAVGLEAESLAKQNTAG